jgi:hypothetical protein
VSRANRKPLPPYASHIDRADELVMVYCGKKAWRLAAPAPDRVASLIYPAGRDPQDYRWPVHSKRVLVLGLGEPRMSVDLLIIELLRSGARIVYVDYNGDGDIIYYDPTAERSAA